MEMDGLYVPIHASWYPAFRKEILTFDAARNDDQVDALGLVGQVLDKMIRGRPVVVQTEKPKVLSTDPRSCTVTLDDLFSANEHKRSKYGVSRIH